MDAIIVGAGIAGIAAGRELERRGRSVLVLDKGRGLGGRMATRRFEGAVFDTGAQFFSVRSPEFRNTLEDTLLPEKSATIWYRRKEEPFYRGSPGMTAIPKSLGSPLDVRTSTRVSVVIPKRRAWLVEAAGPNGESETFEGSSLLLTPPVPQILELISEVAERLDGEVIDLLETIRYDPTLALLLLLEGESPIPKPGFGRPKGSEELYWIADNRLKGISPSDTGPAVTIHSTAEFSKTRYEEPDEELAEKLTQAFAAAYPSGSDGTNWSAGARQLKRWRYARPRNATPERSYLLTGDSRLPPAAVAGDAFGGPRVEGAYLSGLAAAELLDATLR